jgi:hydroxyacylglutathione hydrolase
MKEERETNPFLRPDSREIRELLKMTDSANADVFARLRAMKSAG